MRSLHFDCFSGISGDMTLGALVSAGVPLEVVQSGLDKLHLGITVRCQPVKRAGFAALAVSIEAAASSAARYYVDIERLLEASELAPGAKRLGQAIFHRLAQAEAIVHGVPVERVHFHEVGALDSIGDIVGTAIALDWLGIERYTARPVPVGHGTIQSAHGLLPVPAPATAELLKGVPLAQTPIRGELTTPTGAAILTTVVQEWIEQPSLRITAIGYGAGSKDLVEQPNVLRIFVGEGPFAPAQDIVWHLETNLDDAPGEVVGYTLARLLELGALDVWATPVVMKKSRPGVVLCVLVPEALREQAEEVIFRETGTLGIRRLQVYRTKLMRQRATVHTPWGPVAGQIVQRGPTAEFAPEYDDCARVAREHRLPFSRVYEEAKRAFDMSSR